MDEAQITYFTKKENKNEKEHKIAMRLS